MDEDRQTTKRKGGVITKVGVKRTRIGADGNPLQPDDSENLVVDEQTVISQPPDQDSTVVDLDDEKEKAAADLQQTQKENFYRNPEAAAHIAGGVASGFMENLKKELEKQGLGQIADLRGLQIIRNRLHDVSPFMNSILTLRLKIMGEQNDMTARGFIMDFNRTWGTRLTHTDIIMLREIEQIRETMPKDDALKKGQSPPTKQVNKSPEQKGLFDYAKDMSVKFFDTLNRTPEKATKERESLSATSAQSERDLRAARDKNPKDPKFKDKGIIEDASLIEAESKLGKAINPVSFRQKNREKPIKISDRSSLLQIAGVVQVSHINPEPTGQQPVAPLPSRQQTVSLKNIPLSLGNRERQQPVKRESLKLDKFIGDVSEENKQLIEKAESFNLPDVFVPKYDYELPESELQQSLKDQISQSNKEINNWLEKRRTAIDRLTGTRLIIKGTNLFRPPLLSERKEALNIFIETFTTVYEREENMIKEEHSKEMLKLFLSDMNPIQISENLNRMTVEIMRDKSIGIDDRIRMADVVHLLRDCFNLLTQDNLLMVRTLLSTLKRIESRPGNLKAELDQQAYFVERGISPENINNELVQPFKKVCIISLIAIANIFNALNPEILSFMEGQWGAIITGLLGYDVAFFNRIFCFSILPDWSITIIGCLLWFLGLLFTFTRIFRNKDLANFINPKLPPRGGGGPRGSAAEFRRKSKRKSMRKSKRKSMRKSKRKSMRKSKRKSMRKSKRKSMRKSKRKSMRKSMRKSKRKSMRKSMRKSKRKSKRKSMRKSKRKSMRKSKRKSMRKSKRKSMRKSKRKSMRK